MRIAVIGAGGVGGLLAGLLARAGRHEVVLLARGEALAEARRGGLALDVPGDSFTVRPTLVTASPEEAGPCDAVLVAVKAWQVPALAPTLAPLVAGGGVAVPLQNGVEAADRLAAALPPAQVAGGVIWVYAWADGPARTGRSARRRGWWWASGRGAGGRAAPGRWWRRWPTPACGPSSPRT